MIKLKRLNGSEIIVNAELLETVEATPDTIVTLTTGKKIIVETSIDDLINQVISYRQKIHQPYLTLINKREADTGGDDDVG